MAEAAPAPFLLALSLRLQLRRLLEDVCRSEGEPESAPKPVTVCLDPAGPDLRRSCDGEREGGFCCKVAIGAAVAALVPPETGRAGADRRGEPAPEEVRRGRPDLRDELWERGLPPAAACTARLARSTALPCWTHSSTASWWGDC